MDNGIDVDSIGWTTELRDFVQRHLDDCTADLLLSAHKYVGIDVAFAVEQIEARRRLRAKLPEWYSNADLVMGGRVPAEQCSSEIVAKYKRCVIEGDSLCDMTGGMGVDFWYMSEGMRRAVYTERQEFLCRVARHNFSVLADGRHPEVEVRCGDGRTLPIPPVDVIYVDPARRGGDGSRVYAIEDCEPDVVAWQDELLSHARVVLVKLSPMVDVTDVLRKMKNVTEMHVLAVRNECKEILIKQIGSAKQTCGEGLVGQGGIPEKCRIVCVDFFPAYTIKYSFTYSTDDALACAITDKGVMRYLYEPDVTLMKAQAWGNLCKGFSVCQLEHDTRLMTSDGLIEDFPGRIFLVEELTPFSSKVLKRLKRLIPQANISTRNFILTADELRRRTGIKDGGDVYLFGAKVNGYGYMLLKCRKISMPLPSN